MNRRLAAFLLTVLMCAALVTTDAAAAPQVISVNYVGNTVALITSTDVKTVCLTDMNNIILGEISGSLKLDDCIIWAIDVSHVPSQMTMIVLLGWDDRFIVTDYRVQLSGGSPTSPSRTPAPTYAPVGTPWDKLTLTAYPARTKNRSEERITGRSGPGTGFSDAGSFKQSKISYVCAFFTEKYGGRSWVYAEFNYTNGYKRRVYFLTSSLRYDIIPAMSFTGCPATLTRGVTPTYGPASDYDDFTDAALSAGTQLTVLWEENGYVFAEFTCGVGQTRAWIPASYVESR